MDEKQFCAIIRINDISSVCANDDLTNVRCLSRCLSTTRCTRGYAQLRANAPQCCSSNTRHTSLSAATNRP